MAQFKCFTDVHLKRAIEEELHKFAFETKCVQRGRSNFSRVNTNRAFPGFQKKAY
jgi:hypothetical protein